MAQSPDKRVRRDDDMPPRMKRGNEERPDRVPPAEHDTNVRVPEEQWEEHNKRRDTADGHLDGVSPVE